MSGIDVIRRVEEFEGVGIGSILRQGLDSHDGSLVWAVRTLEQATTGGGISPGASYNRGKFDRWVDLPSSWDDRKAPHLLVEK